MNNHEHKVKWVVLLAAIVMVVEIGFGLSTQSMALLSDGIHMGSHVLAIGLSWVAYIAIRRLSSSGSFGGNASRILSLSGYSSGLLLLLFSLFILIEAISRLLNPVTIQYREALIVALIGLGVNLLSAALLHHKREDSDHNIKAAYLHVLADALTSISAIVGLACAMVWNLVWMDAVGAVISSVVIAKWSLQLLKDSGKSLLDID